MHDLMCMSMLQCVRRLADDACNLLRSQGLTPLPQPLVERAFGAIVESINLLLQAIDPNPHPAAWAVLRRTFDAWDSGTPEPALYASIVAGPV